MTANINKTIPALTIIAAMLLCSPCFAFVLKGPHVLHLMTSKLGSPGTLVVSHTLTLYDNADQEPAYEIPERVQYLFPDQFRSDILSDNTTKIHVFSKGQTLTVLDGKISSFSETGMDAYKDILLFRNRPMLETRLIKQGIDISISCLGRFNGKIVYIIGAKYPEASKPQIWIEKETFRPIRYIIKNLSETETETFIEFRYLAWQHFSKIWYPEKIEIYLEDKLERILDVNHIEVNASVKEDLFDIAQLRSIYPAIAPEINGNEETDDLQEIQQSIEDFKKRFE